MRYFLTNRDSAGLDGISIEHKGETLEFYTSIYARTVVGKRDRYFDNLNNWLKSLGGQTNDAIFESLKHIREVFDGRYESHYTHSEIKKSVTNIYKSLNFDDLTSWCWLKGDIVIPSDLLVNLSQLAEQGQPINDLTEKLTYLVDDYREIVVLSLYLKPILPVIGEYLIYCNTNQTAKFRDLHTLSLLSSTDLLRLKVYKRLEVYIEASLEKESRKSISYNTTSSVFGGLGESELPIWLLSRALLRRVVTFSELSGDNLIANIYNTVTQQLGTLDKTFGRVNDKDSARQSTQDRDDNISNIEAYRVKQEVSDGDLGILSVYTENHNEVAFRIDPTIDPMLIELFYKKIKETDGLIIDKARMSIVQWTLSSSISPRGIPSLTKSSLDRVLAVTQALLWHWGLRDLSMLINAFPSPGSLTSAVNVRITKQWLEKFEVLYPYSRAGRSNQSLRQANPAVRAILIVSEELLKHNWTIVLPEPLQKEVNFKLNSPRVIPIEIRDQICELVVKLNNIN